MNKIVIFASGSGTNAQRICEYFRNHPSIRVDRILSNRADAYVLERARALGIPHSSFDRKTFYETDRILDQLHENGIEFIILAGFLWLIPHNLLKSYQGRILNIHPALLPKYGGKGMYGMRVHEAVLAAGDRLSGITIHYVNERYDEGEIVFQATCPVEEGDTAETLAGRIHQLEYRYYPEIIEMVLRERSAKPLT